MIAVTKSSDRIDDATPEQNAVADQIISAVLQLPEVQRAVMLLVSVERLSYSEVAEIMTVPIGTVMGRLPRTRQTIGAFFNDQSEKQLKLLHTERTRGYENG
jgi:RNA polymerase sigma-70 factor, ECF subfamily